jgi:hypothetical protein
MGSDFVNSKHGNVVAIPFTIENATVSTTAVDLALAGGNVTLVPMPFDGSIVGISARASTAIDTGSATFQVHKEGTEYSDQSALSVKIEATTDTTSDVDLETQGSVRPGVMRFSAGDAIGVSYTSSTDMDPTNSNDFDVILFAVLEG